VSLRDSILAADDIDTELVEIPEWDVTVEVRGMTGADRSRILEVAAAGGDGGINIGSMYVETVIASTYDPETGVRIFSQSDKDAILGKSAAAIDRLAQVGMRLSGMDTTAQDAAGKRFPEGTAEAVSV